MLLYTFLWACVVVFCISTVCLIGFNIMGRNIPGLTPEIRSMFNKKVLWVWATSVGLGLAICGLAQALGVGPMIWVSIKNRFLYGFKGCPCKPPPPIPFISSNPSRYTVEPYYHVDGPFATSELVDCYLDYLPNPTLKDLDEHFTNKHPEWKSRPGRVYSLPRKGPGGGIELKMSDRISTYNNVHIQLDVGANELQLKHASFTSGKNQTKPKITPFPVFSIYKVQMIYKNIGHTFSIHATPTEHMSMRKLDHYLVQSHPEWKTRPDRKYYWEDQDHNQVMYTNVYTPASTFLHVTLRVGPNEQPLVKPTKSPSMVWPMYFGKTTKDQMAKIPKDQPIVFVGDWPKVQKEEYEKMKGTIKLSMCAKKKKTS
jgi:hypothetical protein